MVEQTFLLQGNSRTQKEPDIYDITTLNQTKTQLRLIQSTRPQATIKNLPPAGFEPGLRALTFQSLDSSGHNLVEHVVGTFQRLLGDHPGLFQQVGLNVSTGQLSSRTEMDPDEFTLPGMWKEEGK